MEMHCLPLVTLCVCSFWAMMTVNGCFPTETVFELSTIWSQDLRIPWRRLFYIGQESSDFMQVENQQPDFITQTQVTCLKAFGGHRYLVKVTGEEGPALFQCLQFSPLTKQVVRRALTPLHKNETQVNCETDEYVEDEELMMAYRAIKPQVCPLSGGFQIFMDGGANVRPQMCQETLQSYNPSLQFACGGKYVLADFGEDCSPIIPIQSQSPYRLSLLHLQCVDSWEEPDEDGVKVILLQSLSDPYTYWCLHYKPPGDSDGQFFNIHLSFRGKCARTVLKRTEQASTPDEFSTFGSLARYAPSSDTRCDSETPNLQCSAVRFKPDCFKNWKSWQCPSLCQRCNKELAKQDCPFTQTALGHWVGRSGRGELVADVNAKGVKVTGFGTFSCFGHTQSLGVGDVYLMVRNDPNTSCFPFYVCAKISSPSAGVLNFFMTAPERDSMTGEPTQHCKSFAYGPRIIIPSGNVMLTLVDEQSLRAVPCDIPGDALYPSGLGRCQFSLKQCSGDCTTLHSGYDSVSCGNKSMDEIDHHHICQAQVSLEGGNRAIITRSVMTNRYRCWIFINEEELYITKVEDCSSEGVKLVMMDSRFKLENLPVSGLSFDVGEDPNRGSILGGTATFLVALSSVCFWVLIRSCFE